MAAYVIATITIHDPEGYERYAAGTPAAIAAYGGRYLVRGGEVTPEEGEWSPERVVVLEFPSMPAARDWYESDEYGALRPLRQAAAVTDLVFVEGYEG